MDNRELDQLGLAISDMIDKAINSKDFKKLNESIQSTVQGALERAIDSGADALKSAVTGSRGDYKRYRYTPPEEFARKKAADSQRAPKASPYYAQNMTGEKVKGVFMTVAGVLVFLGNGLALLGGAGPVGTAVSTVLLAAGGALAYFGTQHFGRAERFTQYVKALGDKTYINLDQLTKVARKPMNIVQKDVRTMIKTGWFLEGHMDSQETCLITSDETYDYYLKTQAEHRRQEEEQKAAKLQKEKEEQAKRAEEEAKKPVITKEVQEILDKGNAYIARIRKANDAIPGEEISNKISRMEMVVGKIFDRAKEHPEVVSDLKKLMNYYLPMTIKLLDAYADMDRQPVQGENIRRSKEEINATLDTLSAAYEKLLDSVFKETALDVSTDITVLETLLAQEGLTEDDIQKVGREQAQGQTATLKF